MRSHPSLADVALIDARAAASSAGLCESQFWKSLHEDPEAPTPIRFGSRCTRFRVADVRAWIVARTERALADTTAAEANARRAKRASDAAQAKRRATAGGATA